MTELIGTHEIPCLSDSDYAAYALYMKCLAERVESQLVENRAKVDEVLNRPAIMWQLTDTLAQGSGSSTSSANSVLYRYHWDSAFDSRLLATLNLRGWWNVGSLVNCVSSAPVVGNNRIEALSVWPPGTPVSLIDFSAGLALAAASYQDTTWETNTGNGENLKMSFNFYNPGFAGLGPNELGMRMNHGLSVENGGAENVTFTCAIWAIYLGDTPAISIS